MIDAENAGQLAVYDLKNNETINTKLYGKKNDSINIKRKENPRTITERSIAGDEKIRPEEIKTKIKPAITEKVSGVVYQSNNLKQSLYEGILKRQTAVRDLVKYSKGKDGTINISKEIVNSIEHFSGWSVKASKTTFKKILKEGSIFHNSGLPKTTQRIKCGKATSIAKVEDGDFAETTL